MTGREWRHHARLHDAFVRDRPPDSVLLHFGSTTEVEIPDEAEAVWRMWMEPPDLLRVEFAVGEEMVTAVFRGDTWWSWSPSEGAQTNAGRPNVGHGIGPGEGLLDPTAILPAVELETLGRTEILGRPAHRLRAVPVDGDDDFGPSDALHALGSGADEYELVADAERGFLLCSEARLRGEPFLLLEITELSLDNDLPPDTFKRTAVLMYAWP